MTADNRMSPGGAMWCDQHGRWECTANSKRSGQRCHAPAIRGTGKCSKHAGKATAVARAEGEAITAWHALGGSPQVSHREIVLSMMQVAYLRWHVYADMLRRQVEADGEATGDDDGGGDGTSGLVGHTYSAAKDVGIFASGEAVRALARLEAEWADRAVRFAKVAHDMGVDDAVVDVIRRQADQVQSLLTGVVSRLGFAWEDPRVGDAVDAALAEIEAGGDGLAGAGGGY